MGTRAFGDEAHCQVGPGRLEYVDPASTVLSKTGDRFVQRLLHGEPRLRIGVSSTGPEEAFQTVFGPARNDVNMQVRHALADAIVDGDERPRGVQTLLHGGAEQLRAPKQRRNEFRGKIRQRFNVPPRDQQAVAWKERAVIEKGQRLLIFKHDIRLRRSGSDLAEQAIIRHE